MQINTLWVGPLAARTRQSPSTIRRRLLDEPCFNIAAAGAIMRIYLNETKGDLQRAIGNYHSHTPVQHNSYRLKVLEAAKVQHGGRLSPQLRREFIKDRVSSIDK